MHGVGKGKTAKGAGKGQQQGDGKGGKGKGKGCWICGDTRHQKKDCPRLKQQKSLVSAIEDLKKQTEAMLQEEGFVDQMTKAFASLGGMPGMPPGLTGGEKEGEEEDS